MLCQSTKMLGDCDSKQTNVGTHAVHMHSWSHDQNTLYKT